MTVRPGRGAERGCSPGVGVLYRPAEGRQTAYVIENSESWCRAKDLTDAQPGFDSAPSGRSYPQVQHQWRAQIAQRAQGERRDADSAIVIGNESDFRAGDPRTDPRRVGTDRQFHGAGRKRSRRS